MLKSVMFDPYILFVNFHVSCLNFHMHFAHIPNLNELKAKFTGNLGVLSPFAGLSRHICESLYIILLLCYTIGLSTYIYSYRISCYFWYYIIILFCFTKKLSIYYYFYLCILWCYLHFPVTCPLNSGHLWIGFTWRPCVLGMAGDLPLRRSGLLTVQKNGFDHETCGFHLIEIHIYIYMYIYIPIYIYQIFTIHFGFDNEQCGFHNDFIWSNLW
jgi:hypothetical protein